MNRIKRSSKKWSFPKRKLGPDTIVDKNFDIMSDGQQCFYLCKKKTKLIDNTEKQCEFIYRKDYVKSKEDLYHTCFIDDGDITKYGTVQLQKTNSNQPSNIFEAHLMFVGKTNLSLENAVSDSLYKLIEESIKIGQAHPNENPKTLYPKMSRSTFAE